MVVAGRAGSRAATKPIGTRREGLTLVGGRLHTLPKETSVQCGSIGMCVLRFRWNDIDQLMKCVQSQTDAQAKRANSERATGSAQLGSGVRARCLCT
jgi:hypothetical protein